MRIFAYILTAAVFTSTIAMQAGARDLLSPYIERAAFETIDKKKKRKCRRGFKWDSVVRGCVTREPRGSFQKPE